MEVKNLSNEELERLVNKINAELESRQKDEKIKLMNEFKEIATKVLDAGIVIRCEYIDLYKVEVDYNQEEIEFIAYY